MALPLKNRLKKRKDFDDVFKNSKTSKGHFLLVKTAKKAAVDPKIGFIISSKVFKKAVDRNRIRRILAEEAHKNLNIIKTDTIVLVLKAPTTKETEKDVLSKEFNLLLKK